MEKINIYFVVTHPIQYFVPVYQRLSKERQVNCEVFFFSDETVSGGVDKQFGVKFVWDIPLLEGYRYTFIKNRSWKPSIFKGFWGLFNPGIILKLWKLPRGMVVINGWHFSSYIMSFLFASMFGHRVAIYCDAPVYKEINRTGLKNTIRRFMLTRVLFKHMVDKCLYIGTQSRKFYDFNKVEEAKLVFTPFAIDNDRFREGLKRFDRRVERSKLNINEEDFVVLFTGKFISVKRPMDLIKAFENLKVEKKYLVLVGEGELKESLQAYIAGQGIDHVHFTGFINQNELPKYYGIADVLVLCSETETWGLSVNEAMACGLPIVISDMVGCAEDLVKEGRNGFIYPKGDIIALSESIRRVAEDKKSANSLGMESAKIIEGFTIEKSVEGFIAAAR